MSEPSPKKQKLDCKYEFKDEDDDLGILSSTNASSNTSSNSSSDTSLSTGKRLNNKEKIGNLGGNWHEDDAVPINLLEIKYQLKVFVEDQDKVGKLLIMYEKELAARAKGLNHYFLPYKKNGKIYRTRVMFDPNEVWAGTLKASGGGDSRFTLVEDELMYATARLIGNNPKRLKIDVKLGILATGNIGKFPKMYKLLVVATGFGEKYRRVVFMRTDAAIKKKLRSWIHPDSKKSTELKAMRMKSAFANWPTEMKM